MDVTDLRPNAIARPPDWRWEKARLAAENPQAAALLRREDDEFVRKARLFMAANDRAGEDEVERLLLQNRWPNLLNAYKLRYAPQLRLQRYELEARLLAGEELARIETRVHVPPDVTTWYEAVFFNVLDRLDRPGYVVHTIIGEAAQSPSARDHDIIWKIVGFSAGGLVLDRLIDRKVVHGKPLTEGQVGPFIGDTVKGLTDGQMYLASMTTQVNSYTSERIALTYVELEKLRRSADGTAAGDVMTANIGAAVRALGWAVGVRQTFVAADDPDRIVGRLSAEVAAADTAAAELRSSDLVRLQAGDPGRIKALAAVTFPKETTRAPAA